MANIGQNLALAFGYNAIGIPLTAGLLYPFFAVVLSPTIAAAAIALSSLSVVTNANRLRRAPRHRTGPGRAPSPSGAMAPSATVWLGQARGVEVPDGCVDRGRRRRVGRIGQSAGRSERRWPAGRPAAGDRGWSRPQRRRIVTRHSRRGRSPSSKALTSSSSNPVARRSTSGRSKKWTTKPPFS